MPTGLATWILSPLTDGQSIAIAICMISNVNNCFQKVTRASSSGFAFWLDHDSRSAVLQNPMNDEKQAEPACCLMQIPHSESRIMSGLQCERSWSVLGTSGNGYNLPLTPGKMYSLFRSEHGILHHQKRRPTNKRRSPHEQGKTVKWTSCALPFRQDPEGRRRIARPRQAKVQPRPVESPHEPAYPQSRYHH